MWITYSLGAALFAGITAVFAKIGESTIDTKIITALRTTIILICSILIVIITNSFKEIYTINIKTTLYLFLSGITTALLWLSYFKALQLANVNLVTPIDKTSIIITLILSAIFLKEKITIIKILSIILIIIGTLLMTYKKQKSKNNMWLIYAILTAFFTSLATILGKIGLNDINSNLANMIRTIIVFFIIWSIVLIKNNKKEIKKLNIKNWIGIIISGIATCLSWVCYFKALQLKEASIIFVVEKLSIVVAIILSRIILKEKLTKKSILGLIIILIGTYILII